jgi:hypothetical protein
MDSSLTMPELPESFDYFKFTGSWALGSKEVEAIGLGENCVEIVSGTDFTLTEENL